MATIGEVLEAALQATATRPTPPQPLRFTAQFRGARR